MLAAEHELTAGLLGLSSTFPVLERHEARHRLWQHLDAVHLAELREEVPDLIFSGTLINIFYDQAQFLHGLFELVSLLLQFFLSLLLRLELGNIQRRGVAGSGFLEGRQSLKGVLPLLEAHKPEALALVGIVAHDRYACDLAKLGKKCPQIVLAELSGIFCREVLHV